MKKKGRSKEGVFLEKGTNCKYIRLWDKHSIIDCLKTPKN
jgi:hypothetical protein